MINFSIFKNVFDEQKLPCNNLICVDYMFVKYDCVTYSCVDYDQGRI